MLIQALQDITLPDGSNIRAGAVVRVIDQIAAQLIQQGQARERVTTPALETTTAPLGGIPRPPKTTARIESPTPGPGGTILSWQNEDNFITNSVTVAVPTTSCVDLLDGDTSTAVVIPLTASLVDRDPVLTIDEIKAHLRIDPDYTTEDVDIQRMERSAHASCENALNRVGQIDATVGENVKQAMLWVIGIYWEHRDGSSLPEGFDPEQLFRQLLPGEVDFPLGVYS